MKNKNLSCVIIVTILSININAQIGINTTTPASTLDITAKNATGTTTNVDGLLVPRVDRQRAQSMTGIPVSTMIYVNSIGTGAQSGTAANIDTVGYYYFDGTLWTKIKTGSTSSDVNIYNSNGTLTGNRTVTQGANTLAFTGTANNAFSVNGSTLSVDAANNLVGVGTTAPSSVLAVYTRTPGGLTDALSVGINNCKVCNGNAARSITLYNMNRTDDKYIGALDFIPSASATGISGASILGIDRDITNNFAGLQFLTRNATGFAARMTIKSSGNIGMGTDNPRGALDINQGTTNTAGLVLPANQSPSNITNPAGGNVAIGTIIYDLTADCVKVYKSTGWSGCLCGI